MSLNMPLGEAIGSASPLVLLSHARELFTQRELAARLDVTPRTIGRWERLETVCPVLAAAALREIIRTTTREAAAGKFSFIDLFAGIGGMRAGFEQAGGRCVFTSEWNPWAKITYVANYGI